MNWISTCMVVAVVLARGMTAVSAADWTQFRGPGGLGISSRASAHLVLELPRFRAFSLSSIDHSPRTFD